jgi:hypothetical protein
MIARTEIHFPDFTQKIDYKSVITLLGSCFSDNIGEKLDIYRFNSSSNDLGIVYNPVSMAIQLEHLDKSPLDPKLIVEREGKYFHLDYHSKVNAASLDELQRKIIDLNQAFYNRLRSSTHVFITLGTAWVYVFSELGQVVTNCHKMPSYLFSKKMLTRDEIINALLRIISILRTLQPDVTIIFTLSPVRHIKDGIAENQHSKALLLTCIHEILDVKSHYLPVYEVMMDDLRDYRYYADDMLHPSNKAIDYIWSKFTHSFMNEHTLSLLPLAEKIYKMRHHRPFDKQSLAYQNHLDTISLLEVEWSKNFI